MRRQTDLSPGGPERRAEAFAGVIFQANLRSFHPRGLRGLMEPEVTEWLRRMRFRALLSNPASKWRRTSFDGPYSPLDPMQVDEEYGGRDGLVAANNHLVVYEVLPGGDLVTNHADAASDRVQRIFASPERQGADWFRLTSDPSIAHLWEVHKKNIFGLSPRHWEAVLGMHRASTFYPDQWEYNAENPAVIDFLCSVGERMLSDWGYHFLRLDAVAYLAGVRLQSLTGEHERAGIEVVRALRRRLARRRWDARPYPPFLLAEAGGQLNAIAAWLQEGVCDLAYDFEWGPTLLHCLDEGNFTALQRYRDMVLPMAGQLARFLGSHDERNLSHSYYKEPLVQKHGGQHAEFVCHGGDGLILPYAALVPSAEAFVQLMGRTIIGAGVPIVYQTDAGGWKGDPTAGARDVRDPNRCLVPWDGERPNAGWSDEADYPVEPSWKTRSVPAQMKDAGSVMSQIRRLIAVRNGFPSVQWGREVPIASSTSKLDAYAMVGEGNPIICVGGAPEGEAVPAELDLSPWAGKHLRRLRLADGESVERPLEWDDRRSWVSKNGRHEVGVGPQAFEVLEVLED